MALALALYALWTAATYLLEGRVGLLARPPGGGRVVYALVANLAVGVLGTAWLLSRRLRQGEERPERLGFRAAGRAVVAAGLAGALGLAALRAFGGPGVDAAAAANLFAMVLPTSIAEVLVCWCAAGVAVESWASRRIGAFGAVVVAIVAADLLFAAYHLAHSAPFHQPEMMLRLLAPGLVTSLVFFLGRDVYAAIVVQNALGTIGVGRTVDPLDFAGPMPAVILTAALAAALVVAVHVALRRRAPGVG